MAADLEAKKNMEISNKKYLEEREVARRLAREEEIKRWIEIEKEKEETDNIERNDIFEIFECIACNKIFKSEKSFHSHENSKKHRDNVREIKREILRDEKEFQKSSRTPVVDVELSHDGIAFSEDESDGLNEKALCEETDEPEVSYVDSPVEPLTKSERLLLRREEMRDLMSAGKAKKEKPNRRK